jgi:hypothetical protein
MTNDPAVRAAEKIAERYRELRWQYGHVFTPLSIECLTDIIRTEFAEALEDGPRLKWFWDSLSKSARRDLTDEDGEDMAEIRAAIDAARGD